MIILSKEEFLMNKEKYIDLILEGEIFIYPTDTIYGIGSIATSKESVLKIRKAKDRMKMPFSIIAPSKRWIYNNCEIKESDERWISKLPGPYTLIFKLKKKNNLTKLVNPVSNTIGVRMPNNWFLPIVREIGEPLITTSANVHNEDYMTSLENLSPRIKKAVDFVIYEGETIGKPSMIVDLTGDKEKIINRGLQ